MFYETQIDEVDIVDAKDIQSCAEYAVDIFNYLKKTETDFVASYGYMER